MPTDPNADVRRYRNERKRIETAEVTDADRAALLAFGDHLRGENAPSTSYQYLASCRRVAIRAHALDVSPLAEWEKPAFDRFMVRMQDADFPDDLLPERGSWSEGTLRNFRQHVKRFLEWNGHEWAAAIEVGSPAEPSVERADLLAQDELTALWSAAESPRDECLVALPLATWQRNAALRALEVRHVTLPEDGEGQTGFITINDDAHGQKRATGKRPLTWATGPVERLLAKHPARDSAGFEDAPLLYVMTDSGNATKGAPLASAESINRRLRTLAERAGLDRERCVSSAGRRERTIRAHVLRYTGVTRAALSDEYADTTIKAWAGWEMDTPQLKRYVRVVEEDVLASADAAHGLDSALPERPAFDSCPRCRSPVEEWHRACPNCTGLLSDSAFETIDDVADAAAERSVAADSTDRRIDSATYREWIRDDPEAAIAALHDELSSSGS